MSINRRDKRIVLLDRYLSGKTTREENEIIEKWLEGIVMEDSGWQNKTFNQRKQYLESIYQRIEQTVQSKSKVIKMRRWVPLLRVAAVVLVVLISGIWFFTQKKEKNPGGTNRVAREDIVSPGGNKAILTLADGTRLILDSAGTGAISKQGGVTVIKLDEGALSYEDGKGNRQNKEIVYNTISTPPGGQYQVVLSDGTKVWLNAMSSLRYPTAFNGDIRNVELDGEAYFEVNHNELVPFNVKVAGKIDVRVLGTHFNINAYSNEGAIRATLLKGKVKISNPENSVILRPGQQAKSDFASNAIQTLNNVDTDQVVAWKEGYFSFHDASLKDIMRQIERWYNVSVVYEGVIQPRTFEGGIARNASLNEVLQILEESNVHFKLAGRKLIVKP